MTDDDTDTVVSESQVEEEENELPVIQLYGLLEELSYGNSALKTETEMFEKYYNKLESRDQPPLQISEMKMLGAEFAQLRIRYRSKSRIAMDHVKSLSIDQKCELVQKELEDTKDEIRHLRANAERDLQYHEAVIEEADIRCTEVQKAMHEFKKDILKTISKKKGSILATQKVMEYIDDMNRQRDNIKDKLRLKNVSLKVQRKKMLLQLRQREEVSEALHDVDFQQLKIENAQFLEAIEARNQELIHLKLASGTTLQVLHAYKTRLQRAMEMSINLEKEILLRNELLEKIERETLQVEEDRAKAEALNKKLRKQLARFRVPPVLLYVREKMLSGDLEKTIRMWERKVEIAEMSLKGYRKAWNKMKTTNEQQLLAIYPPGK
ncbi:coiled-coil domain containing 113 [Rhinolophus ferrumequinum]|uniref:Cilia- and flagella-associated protein 263 n=1 Tax=Rhinolophus ferrumequinum TaxID=59479 RepID=A0A671EKZ0_RHIFE|nr:coiled-coil domain-containing protein 113 [Rhinolophus ferrumequinum]KAF6287665.1 coiled-coil domain containing 113 [Rhinolophus ferrumequinum]